MAAARGTTTFEDLHPDVLTRVLRLLDGPALAAAGSATAHLCALAADPRLWEHLSLSAFPSLRHPRLRALLPSHRSFFSDAFPFPDPAAIPSPSAAAPPCTTLISAVDLFHRGEHLFSRVIEMDTRDPWFLGSPFRVDALDRKEPSPATHASTAPASTDDLTLSWVVLDSVRLRAVNLSSRRPVSVERHWHTGEIHVRFASVVGGSLFAATAVVTCGEEAQPWEVSLTVEDVDGMCLDGKESVAVLQGALEGGRKGWGREGEEEARRRYCAHVARKEDRKEKRARREGWLDMCCVVFGVAFFLALLAFVAIR